ncbi:hypothetical protein HK104_001443 [Borealophlyctis nickersoniae]|nr:hypothetical protein HK104_001443 [Borealophlyctis nickersoniae]
MAEFTDMVLVAADPKTGILTYSGKRIVNGQSVPVVVKASDRDSSKSLEAIARLRYEWQILNALIGGGMLERAQSEDSNNLNLDTIVAYPVKSEPGGMKVEEEDYDVRLVEFSCASRLEREVHRLGTGSAILEGNLHYMAPECTGRMNRSMDYRADFYSLGCVLYELLMGKAPFAHAGSIDSSLDSSLDLSSANAAAASELIFCHLTCTPTSPHELFPDRIPPKVSDVVMKLLQKNAEDRYQHALGIRSDCLKLHDLLRRKLRSSASEESLERADYDLGRYQVGKLDHRSQLVFPQKLYGREKEIQILLEAFERVATGDNEAIFCTVGGYSGVGKSALIGEIHRPVVMHRGRFGQGKIDQYQRNLPFRSFVLAFHDIVSQLLTSPPEVLVSFKEKFEASFAAEGTGSVIVDVLPDLEEIVGPQPPVPLLEADETVQRFQKVIKKFLELFSDQALVLFLDDLQWSDPGTLELITAVITDMEVKKLMIIGAYRSNEVDEHHPLAICLQKVREACQRRLFEIELEALDASSLHELLRDTLSFKADDAPDSDTSESDSESGEKQRPKRSASLANLSDHVFRKTSGNPFFVIHLLKSIHTSHVLHFDWVRKRWVWDQNQLRETKLADNVVDFMVSQMQKLQPEAQRVLSLAACIGDKFDLCLLAKLNEKKMPETAVDLWEALEVGYVIPLDQSYKMPMALSGFESHSIINEEASKVRYQFQHDRVQQAAAMLLPPEECTRTHLRIGQLLIRFTPRNKVEDKIFEIVNQLNTGKELIEDPTARNELARYNLRAGLKAKNAGFSEPASKYLNTGLEIVGIEKGWSQDYDLMKQLILAAIESEYQCCRYQNAKTLIDIAKRNMRTMQDRAAAGLTEIKYYTSQGSLMDSIGVGLEVLQLLGCPIPGDDAGIAAESERLRSELMFEEEQIAALEKLPLLSDPDKLTAISLLVTLIPPILKIGIQVYFGRPSLLVPIILTMVKISVDHGNSAGGCYGYTLFGLLLCGVYMDFKSGYSFGRLSQNILRRHFDTEPIKCQIYKVFASHIQPWKEPMRRCTRNYRVAVQVGVSTCNFEYIGYGATELVIYAFYAGENLRDVQDQCTPLAKLVYKQKQAIGTTYMRVTQQLIKNFLENVDDPCKLHGEAFDEDTMLTPEVLRQQLCMFCFHIGKLTLNYVFRRYEDARVHAEECAKIVGGAVGIILVAEFNWYHSLTLLALVDPSNAEEVAKVKQVVQTNQATMLKWAEHAPTNFRHKDLLVQAELERVQGNRYVAMELYDESIKEARASLFTHEEAIALERAADYYVSLGRIKLAATYAADAYEAYATWGSQSKLQQLNTMRIGDVMWGGRRASTIQEGLMHGSSDHTHVDFEDILNASITISGEIVLPKLVKRLIRIVLHNAGAGRAFLIMNHDGELVLEASGLASDESDLVSSERTPINLGDDVPKSIINYVARTKQFLLDSTMPVCLRSANLTDPYFEKHQPKSWLCMPIIYQGKMTGILYLENDVTVDAFTPSRLKILQILTASAAAALENAILYKRLQDYSQNLSTMVDQRTSELRDKNTSLEIEVQERMRAQQVTQEAMEMAKAATMAKSIFLANMSHEIRYAELKINPSSTQITSNQDSGMSNCLMDTDLSPLQEDYANVINTSAEELLNIINDILDFSKIESGKSDLEEAPFSLRTCIEGALDLLAPKASEKGLELLYTRETDVPDTFMGDVTRLRQIIVNLLSNAVKFTKQGEVVVGVDIERLDDGSVPVDHGLYIIKFQVRDTGIGIPSDRMGRLFQSFSQVDSSTTRNYGGTGLGLAISKKLSELMGGQMWCESEAGKGSTFKFTVKMRAAPALDAKTIDESLAILHGKTVLVVDDNMTNRTILLKFCESWGMKAITVPSGESALELLRGGAKVDLAVLDMQMPLGMSGYTLATKIREFTDVKTMPLLLLTSIGCRFTEEEKRTAQFSAQLMKPVKKSRLCHSLAEVLLRRDQMKRKEAKLRSSKGQDGEEQPVEKKPVPKIAKKCSASSMTQLPGPLADLKSWKLLLAEDNPVNQKVAVHLLQRVGLSIDVVGNGKEALEAVRNYDYKMVLMDMMMPVMDGLEATRQIRATLPPEKQPKIIALTANAMAGDRENCLAAGSDDYCSKPIRMDQLLAAMLRCVDPNHANGSNSSLNDSDPNAPPVNSSNNTLTDTEPNSQPET